MSRNITKCLLITMILFLQLSPSTALQKYICMDGAHTEVSTFEDILHFQKNQMDFNNRNNFVGFNILKIPHVKTNDFVAHDSNYVRKLILKDKQIEIVDKGSFNELYCLRYLFLQNNLIGNIENGTFSGLFSLHELNLSGNNIESVPDRSFWDLKHLYKLDLSKNKLKEFFDGSFQYLRSLYELDLSYNEIQSLPDKLFQFSAHLNQLYLNGNKIKVPRKEEYLFLRNLDLLSLNSNQITKIGEGAFLNLTISELSLFDNQLVALNVSQMPITLGRINISKNYFRCDYLNKLIEILEKFHINMVPNQIDCFNGTVPPTIIPTTTSKKPYTTTSTTTTEKVIIIPKIINNNNYEDHFWKIEHENERLSKAISDLKTIVIVLVTFLVIFHVVDVLIRTKSFEKLGCRFRRRPFMDVTEQARYSNYSLPLLQR